MDAHERPTRSPTIELLGAMRGTAYAERKFLVRRDAAYLQLTELLYRVLELADGAHSCERIAAYVAATTGRVISAADVHRVIEVRLRPAGLMAGGDAPPQRRQVSPLAMNLRAVAVGPRAVDLIARLASPLFSPAVALAVVIATIGTRLWLYTRHGVGDSLRDLVYHPGAMAIIVALVVASAAFHEVGHAAALRRAGGRSRGMGIGLYLIYPVFFTDVTESYRLSKWRRVLTDVGGFYFNLIFALLASAAYIGSGHEFVLTAVMLTDLEILHQLLPLGRLDGYWLLTDLTGIPDFIAGAGSFLRGLLPWRRTPATEAVRPIARAVYATYLAVIGPLFALLAYVIATSAPRLVAATLDSFLRQSDAFDAARIDGDLGAGVAAVGQAILLVLPLLAIAFFFATLAHAAARLLWRVSGRTRAERVAGVASIAMAAALIAMVWWRPLAPITAATDDAYKDAPQRVARIADLTPTVAPAVAPARPAPLAPAPTPRLSLAVTRTAPPAPVATRTMSPSPSPTATSSPTASPTPSPPPTGTRSTK